MRICLAFYPIMDPGGLTNNNSNLCAGLQELGHETDTILLLPRTTVPRNGVSGGKGTVCPYTGFEHDQMRGYTWPVKACVPYRGEALWTAIDRLNTYDLIIWQIPVPTKKQENLGNMDWMQLYKHATPPQVAYVHDGNLIDGYPWMSLIAPYLKGVGGVNHAALHSCKQLSVKYSLTPSPQPVMEMPDLSLSAWQEKYPGFLSLQTFKAWKHVPELVAAIPHVSQGVLKYLAGKGIDYHYLTSKTKCKWPGIWDAAVAEGMEYLGVITNHMRDETLRGLTCLVDPSWSKKYATIGDHYNRVTVEAIKCGALPVVRPLGISTNLEGQGEVFKAGVNCYAIPQGCTPAQYGEALTEACTLPYNAWSKLMENAAQLLPMWDRKNVAQTFIDLSRGIHEYEGVTTPKVNIGTMSAVAHFFGADV